MTNGNPPCSWYSPWTQEEPPLATAQCSKWDETTRTCGRNETCSRPWLKNVQEKT